MKLENKLIKACRKGDRTAQETVYRLLYPETLKVAMRYSSCEEDARAILNKAMFKVFTKLKQFRGNGDNFFGWVKRIVMNQALDELKSTSFSRSFIPLHDADTEYAHDDLNARFDYDNVIELIQRLPNTSACVFNLYAVDGYSHKEIAKMLDITVDNSRYHLHAARKQLKQWIFKTEQV